MKRLNQKGDAALYIISVAVVIALIGFAGWRVWKSMEESKQSKTNSSTQTSEQSQTAPVSDLAEQKVEGTDLTFFYPITQGPATTATDADLGGGPHPSKIAAYKFKDYVVEVSDAKNTMIDIGLTGRVMCNYDVTTEMMTPESPDQPEKCQFEKKMLNGEIEFHNASNTSESRNLTVYVAATGDKKYVISLSRLDNIPECYGATYNQVTCTQKQNTYESLLDAEALQFVRINKNLFRIE